MTDDWTTNRRMKRQPRRYKIPQDTMTKLLQDMMQECGSNSKCLECNVIAPLLGRAKKLLKQS